jgi:type III secretory pathway component EscV
MAIDPSHTRTAVMFGVVPPPEWEGVRMGDCVVIENELIVQRHSAEMLAEKIKHIVSGENYEAFVMDQMMGRQTSAGQNRTVFQVYAEALAAQSIVSRITKSQFIPGCNVPTTRHNAVRQFLAIGETGCPTMMFVESRTPGLQKEFGSYRKKQMVIGHEEVQQLLDVLARTTPKLVEDLVPNVVPVGVVLRVLQNLLEERIPVRDMRTIAETLAEHGLKSQDPGALTAAVRVSLGRSIIQHINGIGAEVQVITLDPSLEQILLQSIQATAEGGAGIEPGLAERMHRSLAESAQRQEAAGQAAVLLVAPPVRPWLARLVRHSIPNLNVLAYNEIPDNKQIKVVANIGHETAGLGMQNGGQTA